MARFSKRCAGVLLIGLAILCIAFLLHYWPSSKWTNFHKIKPGMTRSEVEALMGEPEILSPGRLGWHIDATLSSEELILIVHYDKTERVIDKDADSIGSSRLQKVRQWLGL
jgi:hypothetical protein